MGKDPRDDPDFLEKLRQWDTFYDAALPSGAGLTPDAGGSTPSELYAADAIAVMTPYYDDGQCVIYHGDALDILPGLAESFDLGFADPPYNAGKNYGPDVDDARSDFEYHFWSNGWFRPLREHCARVIVTPGHGHLADWMARTPSGVACWYKPGNPAKGGMFQFCEWEPMLVWGKGWGGSDVFRATVSKQRDTGDHPCPKPLGLLRQVIARTKPASVIDPFIGTGTTLIAAREWGAERIVGIEISERYCELAARRLSQGVMPLDWESED